MKEYLKNKKIIFSLLGFAVFLMFALYFIIFPLCQKVKNAADSIQEKSIDRELDQKRIESIPELEKEWMLIEGHKEALGTILGPDEELGFIESVEKIAKESGNTIALKIGDPSNPKEIEKLKKAAAKKTGENEKGIMDELQYPNYFPIQISLKGNFNSFYKFIYLLENGQFYVNIINFEVKKEEISEDDRMISSSRFSGKIQKDSALPKKYLLGANINALVYAQ